MIFMVGYVNKDAKRRACIRPMDLPRIVLMPGYLVLGSSFYLLMLEPLPYQLPAVRHDCRRSLQLLSQLKCQSHPACPQLQARSRGNRQVLPLLRQDLDPRNSPNKRPA